MQVHSSQIGRVPGGYSFELLGRHDLAKLATFLLSLNFDQRRSYFAGGLSDPAIAEFCNTIDWTRTRIVASCIFDRLDGIAVLAYTSPNFETAELSMAYSGGRDCPRVVSGLFDLAMAIAAPHCEVSILREFAIPELIQMIRQRKLGTFMTDEIRIPVHLMQELSAS